RPPALADVVNVYCAVLVKDSRMRRAIFSRMPDMRVAGGTRSLERTMPAVPEPSPPTSMPSSICFFAKEETRGVEWINLGGGYFTNQAPRPGPAAAPRRDKT